MASSTALMTAGGEPIAPASPHPFRSNWIVGTWRAGHTNREVREVIRSWHAVVHVRSRNQLSCIIVNRLLQKGLTNSLGDTPMDLPFHDHWIDQIAKIVNRDKLNDLSYPRIRIDFDLTNMRASGA